VRQCFARVALPPEQESPLRCAPDAKSVQLALEETKFTKTLKTLPGGSTLHLSFPFVCFTSEINHGTPLPCPSKRAPCTLQGAFEDWKGQNISWWLTSPPEPSASPLVDSSPNHARALRISICSFLAESVNSISPVLLMSKMLYLCTIHLQSTLAAS